MYNPAARLESGDSSSASNITSTWLNLSKRGHGCFSDRQHLVVPCRWSSRTESMHALFQNRWGVFFVWSIIHAARERLRSPVSFRTGWVADPPSAGGSHRQAPNPLDTFPWSWSDGWCSAFSDCIIFATAVASLKIKKMCFGATLLNVYLTFHSTVNILISIFFSTF